MGDTEAILFQLKMMLEQYSTWSNAVQCNGPNISQQNQ